MEIKQTTDIPRYGRVETFLDTFPNSGETKFNISVEGDCCIESGHYHWTNQCVVLEIDEATELRDELDSFIRFQEEYGDS